MDITWNIIEWYKTTNDPFKIILLYLLVQMINVVTSTLKSVILVKGTKKAAIAINTFHYVINALVVALIGNVIANIPIVLIITAITNFIGVWWGLTLIDKLKKDRLWRISATVKSADWESLKNDLKNHNIKFIKFETDWDKIDLIDVFSHSREESSQISEIFSHYKVKYTIYSNNYNL